MVYRSDAARGLEKRLLAAAAVLALVAGCGGEPGGAARTAAPTAATLGEQTVLTAAEYLALPPYADANREKGRRRAEVCAACHTFEAGGRAMVGPNLHEFFGTVAGTRPGFDYSNVLRGADFVWTPRALDAWLAEPARFLPGNRMSFIGIRDAGDRADLIAWLLATVGSREAIRSEGERQTD